MARGALVESPRQRRITLAHGVGEHVAAAPRPSLVLEPQQVLEGIGVAGFLEAWSPEIDLIIWSLGRAAPIFTPRLRLRTRRAAR